MSRNVLVRHRPAAPAMSMPDLPRGQLLRRGKLVGRLALGLRQRFLGLQRVRRLR
jgi:hypothetical protein